MADFASKRASWEGGIHPIWPGQRNVLIICGVCMLVYGGQSVSSVQDPFSKTAERSGPKNVW